MSRSHPYVIAVESRGYVWNANTLVWEPAEASGGAVGSDVNVTNSSLAVTGSFYQATQPVSIASMPSTPVTGTFYQVTQPVSGTFWQVTQPVSVAALPLPSNAASETGGNLATIAAKDFATAARQDTLLTELQQKLEVADLATLATSAKQDTGNTSLSTISAGLLLAQGAVSTSVTGPLVQAVVSDTPQSYNPDQVYPLSITTEGRLRVATVPADIDQVWQHTFDNPFAYDTPSAADSGAW